MKHCTYCDTIKSPEDFNKSKSAKDGCQSRCRACERTYQTGRKKEKAALVKKWRQENPELHKQQYQAYRDKNRESVNAQAREWRATNKERANLVRRERYALKREEKRAYQDKWKAKNREKLRTWNREYAREQRATNPQFVIRHRITSRIRDALVNDAKSASSMELLGCSMGDYKAYLQSLFAEGMTWEIFLEGCIHIDHKIPCCSFDLTDPAQQKACFHYTNTQPMWKIENHKKLAKDLRIKRAKEAEKAANFGVSPINESNVPIQTFINPS